MNNALGYWWTTDIMEGWEGFAPTREEALAQCKATCGDDDFIDEVQLRPGYDSPEDDGTPIEFTGPSEFIQLAP